MNWYKTLKLSSSIGEWWLSDGNAMYADGDIGDMNHEMYVIDYIQSKYGKEENQSWDEYIQELAHNGFNEQLQLRPDEREQITEEFQYDPDQFAWPVLQSMGMTDEELSIAGGFGDARLFGLKQLGWKRVAGNNVQTWALTANDLDEITSGLYDAVQDQVDEMEFNIEVCSNNSMFWNVPYAFIADRNPMKLREFAQRY